MSGFDDELWNRLVEEHDADSVSLQTERTRVEAGCKTVSDFLFVDPQAKDSESFTYSADRARTHPPQPGYGYVIAAEQLPNGEIATAIGQIPKPLPSCYAPQAYTIRQIGEKNGEPVVTEVPVNPTAPPAAANTSTATTNSGTTTNTSTATTNSGTTTTNG